MSSYRRWFACVLVAALAAALTGCGSDLSASVLSALAPEAQYVVENPAQFTAPADDPLQSVDPGTVIDDLHTLNGCWGALLTDNGDASDVALYVVWHFDAAAQTFDRWSFVGLSSGGLLPSAPLVSLERGTFEVTGTNTLRMTLQHLYANVNDATGSLTTDLREIEMTADTQTQRDGLVTRSGDRMLFYIDIATPDQVDPTAERAIFYQFDCSASP
jgi:hypothetical protein